MEDTVEVVIKIPKDVYDMFKKMNVQRASTIEHVAFKAIANGTVLPKGHSDLIEYRPVCGKEYDFIEQNCDHCMYELICGYISAMPTIIPRDSEVE